MPAAQIVKNHHGADKKRPLIIYAPAILQTGMTAIYINWNIMKQTNVMLSSAIIVIMVSRVKMIQPALNVMAGCWHM